MNNIQIEIQNESASQDIPSKLNLRKWVKSALNEITKAEITIRIVDEEESSQLNETYRHKKGPTNVLSFPFDSPIFPDCLLGDIVICAPVVKHEASLQNKNELAHWAHLTIHGILHLQGYDHITEGDAAKMESLEIAILKKLGFANPY